MVWTTTPFASIEKYGPIIDNHGLVTPPRQRVLELATATDPIDQNNESSPSKPKPRGKSGGRVAAAAALKKDDDPAAAALKKDDDSAAAVPKKDDSSEDDEDNITISNLASNAPKDKCKKKSPKKTSGRAKKPKAKAPKGGEPKSKRTRTTKRS